MKQILQIPSREGDGNVVGTDNIIGVVARKERGLKGAICIC